MNYSRKYIKIFLKGIVLSITIFFLSVSSVNAESPRLEVIFNPNPLFEKLNFLPGESSFGTITVTNNSGETQKIITESINGVDYDNLGSILDLRIFKEGTPDFYHNSLGYFLSSAGEVGLSSLSDGATVTYVYEVIFGEDAEEYQSATLGFDICIGFENENGKACGNTVIGGEKDTDGGDLPDDEGGTISGTGGGGGFLHKNPLIIKDEGVINSNIPLGTATIVWDTNLLSTSQVIYGLESGGPYVLDLNDNDGGITYLGYPFWTNEDPIKVTSHSVLLTGLVDGEVYRFRVVSRASPPTIGFEYVFEFKEPTATEIVDPKIGVIVHAGAGLSSAPMTNFKEKALKSGSERKNFTNGKEIIVGEDVENNNNLSNDNLANILSALPNLSSKCIFGLFVILLVLFIAQKIWIKFLGKDDNKKVKEKNTLFWIIGIALAVAITCLVGLWCIVAPLIAIFVILVIWYLVYKLDLYKKYF